MLDLTWLTVIYSGLLALGPRRKTLGEGNLEERSDAARKLNTESYMHSEEAGFVVPRPEMEHLCGFS